MRYRIHGANRKTGVETSMTIEAPTEDAAEAIALKTLIVYKVSEEPDPLDEAIAEEADHPAAQPPLPYAAPAPRPPSYDGIRVGAVILGIMAPALWIAGVIAFLVYFERQNEPLDVGLRNCLRSDHGDARCDWLGGSGHRAEQL